MEEIRLSENAKKALSSIQPQKMDVAGLYIDGNTIFAGWISQGKSKTKEYGLKWRDFEGFYQPVSRMDIPCGEGVDYGTLFQEVLLQILKDILADVSSRSLLAAVSLPGRDIWMRDSERYLSVLENWMDGLDGRVFPAVIPAAMILGGAVKGKKKSLLVSVEREWTEFFLVENQQVIRRTAAHIGLADGEDPSCPVALRMNDYLNDSTSVWSGLWKDCWMDAFLEILCRLQGHGWEETSEIQIACPDPLWDKLSEGLSGKGIQVGRISDLGERTLQLAKTVIASRINSSLAGASRTKTDDLWKL